MFYNGIDVDLPDIDTVWTDKKTRPYAVIFNDEESGLEAYRLLIGTNKATVSWQSTRLYAQVPAVNDYYFVKNGAWTRYGGSTSGDTFFGIENTGKHWANHDVINTTDGTVFISESADPNTSVTGISIMSNNSVEKGGYLIVAANVSGTGNFDKSCTASISGASSSKIGKLTNGQNWMLECGTDETASEITVTVTSDADPTITASKTITVVEAGTGGDGGDDGDDSGGGTGGDGTGGGTTGASAEDLQAAFMAGLATGLALYSRKG